MTPTEKYRHFFLKGVTRTEPYRPIARGGKRPVVPEQNQARHGRKLLHEINNLINELEKDTTPVSEIPDQTDATSGLGYRIQFESFRDVPLIAERLAHEGLGIELLNVRITKDTNQTIATVFVPTGKLKYFKAIVHDYLNKKRNKIGHSRERKSLINAIERIQKVTVNDLWTDDLEVFPASTKKPIWWEVWLRAPRGQQKILKAFLQQIKSLGMKAAPGALMFPERVVLLVYTSKKELQNSMEQLANMAELRCPKKSADFFENLSTNEDRKQLESLLERTKYTGNNTAPYICLLDTGVNRGHNLLEPALSSVDMYTMEPAWGTNDFDGHGTEMAGLALWGNLTEALQSQNGIEISHRLESVKLIRENNTPPGTSYHFGVRTVEAVARPEITDPNRLRVFGMTITARDNRDGGKPSAWSATLDSLAADVSDSLITAVSDSPAADVSDSPASDVSDSLVTYVSDSPASDVSDSPTADASNNTPHPRLLIVSAGNTKRDGWFHYPESNDKDGVHDPAQAWNALTVGAYTNLVQIDEPNTVDFRPIAPIGGLSPFSTTSKPWKDKGWPFKPDVVCEGGNVALDSQNDPTTMSSLSLLTTYHKPTRRSFATTTATSAATALASRFAAQILIEYPNLWPETVRALIVHSAEWTEAMKSCPPLCGKLSSKKEYEILLRRCGFGVPNLDQALWSLANSLTMIVEEKLQPFQKTRGSLPVLANMQIHNLPWPRAALGKIGNTTVEMRVTLSYFIEPNPSQRGYSSRYCYQSHGLRFDIKRSSETVDEFRERINLHARDDNKKPSQPSHDKEWLIGYKNRHRGSIHGDIWQGSAADLASRECIAIYPTSGWWKTRPKRERYSQSARYALIVSIKAPEVGVDLYTEVKNRIITKTEVTA